MHVKAEVWAGAGEEAVLRRAPDAFVIYVREKPERNMANERVCSLIRRTFGETGVSVRITSGHRSRHKILSVEIRKSS